MEEKYEECYLQLLDYEEIWPSASNMNFTLQSSLDLRKKSPKREIENWIRSNEEDEESELKYLQVWTIGNYNPYSFTFSLNDT